MQAHPLSTTAARIPAPTTASLAAGPGLAHDAGNFLAALELYCDLLDAPGVLQPRHVHYARELRLLAARSSSLLQRLLQADCADSDDQIAHCGFSPASALRRLQPLLNAVAGSGNTLALDIGDAVPDLGFAGDAFERVVMNLVRNAGSALAGAGQQHAGKIHISLRRFGTNTGAGGVRLTVSDNGPGMPMAAAACFLKPRPLPEGAVRGLGHRIVRELLNETGGVLSITATRNRGTTITVDWPAESEVQGRLAARSLPERGYAAEAGVLPC